MKIEFLVAYNNYKVGEIVDLGDDSSTVEAFSGKYSVPSTTMAPSTVSDMSCGTYCVVTLFSRTLNS